MNYLFVTIKRVGKRLPTEGDYENYIYNLKKSLVNSPYQMDICKRVIETDDHGRKHLHMIILVDTYFDWNKLKIYRTNWHVHTVYIESPQDLERISNYMDKEVTVFMRAIKEGAYLFQ